MLVTGPEPTREVTVTHSHAFIGPLVLRRMHMTFGEAMFVADGPQWLRHRRIAQQAFHRPRIASSKSRPGWSAGQLFACDSGFIAVSAAWLIAGGAAGCGIRVRRSPRGHPSRVSVHRYE